MSLPEFKNDLELAAYAVANPGFKIRHESWPKEHFIYFSHSDKWIAHDGVKTLFRFECINRFKPYTEPKPAPKLVTWWVPVVLWHEDVNFPWYLYSSLSYRTKEEFHKKNTGIKVLEWRSFEAPETYEECE